MCFTANNSIGWLEVGINNEELHYAKVEKPTDGFPQIERGLVIKKDFTWNIHCKESQISSDSDLCSSIPNVISSLSSCKFALELINSFTLCQGNADKKFAPLVEQRKGVFTNADGKLKYPVAYNYYD